MWSLIQVGELGVHHRPSVGRRGSRGTGGRGRTIRGSSGSPRARPARPASWRRTMSRSPSAPTSPTRMLWEPSGARTWRVQLAPWPPFRKKPTRFCGRLVHLGEDDVEAPVAVHVGELEGVDVVHRARDGMLDPAPARSRGRRRLVPGHLALALAEREDHVRTAVLVQVRDRDRHGARLPARVERVLLPGCGRRAGRAAPRASSRSARCPSACRR